MRNLILAAAIFATGCATGSHKVTGMLRQPISPDNVVIYYSTPAKATLIGTVSASSFGGVTFQNATDYALAKLKLESGNLGANGIVLEYLDNKALGGAKVQGLAIFVTPAGVSEVR